jgi:hypothetical protein
MWKVELKRLLRTALRVGPEWAESLVEQTDKMDEVQAEAWVRALQSAALTRLVGAYAPERREHAD